MTEVSVVGGVGVGVVSPATLMPVVEATADAVGLGPNSPPTVLAKLENSEGILPMIPNAESIAGTPVLIVPNPPVANSVDPGSCGIPSLARM